MRLGWRPVDSALACVVALICVGMTAAFWLLLAPSGGTYSNPAYHFRISYPSGWKVNVSSGAVPGVWTTQAPNNEPSATPATDQTRAIPLLLTIARPIQQASSATLASALTITVLDLRDKYIANQAAGLASNAALHSVTLSGLPAIASAPTVQLLASAVATPDAVPTAATRPPGPPTAGPDCAAGSASRSASAQPLTDTHTDYYLVRGGYEYQISTDAVSGDCASEALHSMLQSFTITA